MVTFPPCKINLGLDVVYRRHDGYHDIETCFYPIPWTDALEIISSNSLMFTTSGIAIPGKPEENLCLKAYALLKKDFNLSPVGIHLHKVIPLGAGLGGGSSDGAHTLRLLNVKFELGLTTERLKQYALELGSDCPFFIEDKSMLASGRGEILSATTVNLTGKFIVIIKPEVHVSTAEAYAGVKPRLQTIPIKSVIEKLPLHQWKNHLKNDFEESVFDKYPVIQEIRQRFYQRGAIYSSMSGSGSAVYALFDKPTDLKNEFKNDLYWSSILS